nr:hypothetical protein [Tanacetum cinerariifolium]
IKQPLPDVALQVLPDERGEQAKRKPQLEGVQESYLGQALGYFLESPRAQKRLEQKGAPRHFHRRYLGPVKADVLSFHAQAVFGYAVGLHAFGRLGGPLNQLRFFEKRIPAQAAAIILRKIKRHCGLGVDGYLLGKFDGVH